MSSGWIKLHRKIKDHWLFHDDKKFKAWISILLEVNHKERDILLGNKVFRCKAGESYKSLDSWSRTFGIGWSKSATRLFFDLLKKEKIIDTNNVKKTTHLTICKWDTYQLMRHEGETQVKRKRNASETQATLNKNDKERIKNDKEIKKYKYPISKALKNIPEDYKELFFSWLSVYFEIHGKMAEASQEAQFRRLMDIPKKNRVRCLNDAIAGQWKNIQDVLVDNKNGVKSEQDKLLELVEKMPTAFDDDFVENHEVVMPEIF